MVEIEIDKNSGFCFGVVNAIESAERELKKNDSLYCLGDLVHNNLEMKRLRNLGLKAINHEELATLRDKTVLLRAHGEPPSTYLTASRNNIKILDATCPVVLHLQERIKKCYEEIKNTDTQLVIYGKKGHAEVNGLVGQTDDKAIVTEKPEDLERLDFQKNIVLFSQTTKQLDGFGEIVEIIKSRMKEGVEFRYFDTICRQVANRLPKIKEFAAGHDRIYFVAGEKSSNGKMLYEECKKTNPNTVFISKSAEITELLPENVRTVGICGATSTPKWLMEEVAERIRTLLNCRFRQKILPLPSETQKSHNRIF
jgi:4-hydroxy-3-methylbut-2-enyl diphosphate reductase